MLKAGICGFGALGHVHANSLSKLDGVAVFSLPKAVKALGLLYKPRSGPEVRVPFK